MRRPVHAPRPDGPGRRRARAKFKQGGAIQAKDSPSRIAHANLTRICLDGGTVRGARAGGGCARIRSLAAVLQALAGVSRQLASTEQDLSTVTILATDLLAPSGTRHHWRKSPGMRVFGIDGLASDAKAAEAN